MRTSDKPIKIPPITQQDIELGRVWDIVKGFLVSSGDNLGKGTRFTYKKIIRSELCVYCRTNKAEGLDHIQPRILGGPDGWTNRAPACGRCDKAKGHRSVLMFLIAPLLPKKKRKRRKKKKCNSSLDLSKTDPLPLS